MDPLYFWILLNLIEDSDRSLVTVDVFAFAELTIVNRVVLLWCGSLSVVLISDGYISA
jgi:hypothetical protein